MNDLPNLFPQGDAVLYADDTSCLSHSSNIPDLLNTVNTSISRMAEWCNNNHLSINTNKTVFLDFHPKTGTFLANHQLKLMNEPISRSNCVKFLGLLVSDDLKWTPHIEAIMNRVSTGIFMLRRLAPILSLATLKLIYHANVHAHISYGIMFWGISNHAKKLFSLQKQAIKAMIQVPKRTPGKPIFLALKILTLPSIFILNCATFVKLHPQHFPRNEEWHDHHTRTKGDVHLKSHHLSLALKGPHHTPAIIFNKLPVELKNCPPSLFKVRLRNFLASKAYYDISEYLNECM